MARIRRTTPAPTPLRIGNTELTWPLGAVISRAGVETGGDPVGMALRDVGGDGTVDGGTVGWDCRRGAVGRVVARVGGRVAGAAAVAGATVTGAEVTGAEVAGGLVVAGGVVAGIVPAGAVPTGAVGAAALVAGSAGATDWISCGRTPR